MNVYFDASVLVALFSFDYFSARANRAFRGLSVKALVSDFAAAEFASAIARRARMQDLTRQQAQMAFEKFDSWTASGSRRIETFSADIREAERIVRRLDLTLRAPDALHIVIAQRIGAELATFDTRMAENARALGLALAPL